MIHARFFWIWKATSYFKGVEILQGWGKNISDFSRLLCMKSFSILILTHCVYRSHMNDMNWDTWMTVWLLRFWFFCITRMTYSYCVEVFSHLNDTSLFWYCVCARASPIWQLSHFVLCSSVHNLTNRRLSNTGCFTTALCTWLLNVVGNV